MTTKPLSFVTGNPNKLAEVRAILSTGTPIEIESQNFDRGPSVYFENPIYDCLQVVPEIQGTTQEVAREKCRRAAELVGGPCITEDAALCFKALGGLPGPYIKWFLKELGNDGLLKLLDGFSTNDAFALCTFAYSSGPGAEPILFEGRTEGRIVSARGPKNYFGWNPIFEVEDTGLTYAEMPPGMKNKISHRFRALEKLRAHLQTQIPQLVKHW